MILFQVTYYLFIGVLKFPFVAFGKCFASLAGEPTWNCDKNILSLAS